MADLPFLFLPHVVCLDVWRSEEAAETEESQGCRKAAADTTINHFVGKVSLLLVGLVYFVFLVEFSEELVLFQSCCWLE